MCVCLRATQEGRGRLWSQIGSGKASRLFTSYFLFSCLQPLPVLPLAAVRDVSAPRVTGSIGGNMHRVECVCLPIGGIGLFNKQHRKGTVWRSWVFSFTHLLSEFLNHISGHCRSFDWVMWWREGKWLLNAGMYQQWAERVCFLSCFPERVVSVSQLSFYCWCYKVRGRCDPRSLARHSCYLSFYYCFVWQDVFINQVDLN